MERERCVRKERESQWRRGERTKSRKRGGVLYMEKGGGCSYRGGKKTVCVCGVVVVVVSRR